MSAIPTNSAGGCYPPYTETYPSQNTWNYIPSIEYYDFMTVHGEFYRVNRYTGQAWKLRPSTGGSAWYLVKEEEVSDK